MEKVFKKVFKKWKKFKTDFAKKNMKIGVSYNLFDGEELLEASIKCIRNKVSHINIVYQTTSNFGETAPNDLKDKLEDLMQKGLVDEIYFYKPNTKLKPHDNEKRKRDIGLKLAKKAHCTHFLSMDTDEFYDTDEFEKAINYIALNNVTTSAVSIIEYLKSEEYQLIGGYTFTPDRVFPYNFYAPFIIKIKKFGSQKHGARYFPCYTDPTRKLQHKGRFRLFPVQEIAMHHMSTLRKDLAKKYNNTSMLYAGKKNELYVKKIQKEILDFDFEKCKKLPENFAIFNDCLVRKVDKKFGIEIN